MTVGELRKALEGVADDLVVLTNDEGHLTDNVQPAVCNCAPLSGQAVLSEIWEHSRHPAGTVGQPYFVI